LKGVEEENWGIQRDLRKTLAPAEKKTEALCPRSEGVGLGTIYPRRERTGRRKGVVPKKEKRLRGKRPARGSRMRGRREGPQNSFRSAGSVEGY